MTEFATLACHQALVVRFAQTIRFDPHELRNLEAVYHVIQSKMDKIADGGTTPADIYNELCALYLEKQ